LFFDRRPLVPVHRRLRVGPSASGAGGAHAGTAGTSTASGGSSFGGAGGTGGILDPVDPVDPNVTYHELTDPERWSTFDLRSVSQLGASPNYSGGSFDGRYLVLSPQGSIAARYDTRAAFGRPESWDALDLARAFPGVQGFSGAVLAGGQVVLVPHASRAVRFDSAAPLGETVSWRVFGLPLGPGADNAGGYQGAATSGRYVYFAPYYNGVLGHHGVVARYDAEGAFDSQGSWSYYAATQVNPNAKGFRGAVSARGYTYFIPFEAGAGPSSLVVRVDQGAPFDAAESWSTFDVATLDAGAAGYLGGAFDGRFVYLAPFSSSLVARYDTQAPFDSETAWELFDASQVAASARSFAGAGFDGRYVYLVPYGADSPMTRFDTTRAFSDVTSWQSFDVTPANRDARGFAGVVFDGSHLYFVPAARTVITRFHARSGGPVPSLSPGGSFF
jgi:hypothetical protein